MEAKTVSALPKQKILEVIIQIILSPILTIVGIVVAWNLCHPKRAKVEGSPKKYHLTYEDVTFKSADKRTNLKGWLMKANQPIGTIIFSHGYRGSRTKSPRKSLEIARYYVNKGYNVLAFDYRNCGESAGIRSTVGVLETKDLIGAIRYIKNSIEFKKLILMGWSTGGSCAIMAAASEKVDAVVTDSAFDNLETYLNDSLSKWTRLPKLVNPFVLFFFPLLNLGYHQRMSNPLNSLKNINCPIYFIHNQHDAKVPHTCTVRMHKSYEGVKKIWITSKGGHVKNHLSNKDYLTKVDNFIENI